MTSDMEHVSVASEFQHHPIASVFNAYILNEIAGAVYLKICNQPLTLLYRCVVSLTERERAIGSAAKSQVLSHL